MKKIKLIIICMISAILCLCLPVTAHAEEKAPAYACSPIVGVVPLNTNCPLVVTEALFDFKINAFPEEGGDLSAFDSKLDATYTISNTTEQDVEANMSLVLGNAPQYGTNAFPEGATTVKLNGADVAISQKNVDGVYSADFTITVQAGATASLLASFPVYPGTEPSYKPLVYTYSLSITGLKKWNSFKKFTVNVASEYHVVGSSVFGFSEKVEPKQEFNSIPEKDFMFYLCTDDDPKNPSASWAITLLVVLMITVTFGPVLLTILIINLVNKSKKRKQKERYENRYNIYK